MQISVRTFGIAVGARTPLAGSFRPDVAPRVVKPVRVATSRLRLATIVPVVVEIIAFVHLAIPVAQIAVRLNIFFKRFKIVY